MSDSCHDFDFIVIGSGFGGSVTAHRLTEKGYRVAVMEMGRRWTPENLPSTNWIIWRWFWRPRLALRGFFNMEFFKHVVILHGCAVGGGSITYANTMLVPAELRMGQRLLGRPGGLEGADAAPLRHRHPDARRDGEPHPGPGRPLPEAGGRRGGRGSHVLPHQRRRVRAARRRGRRQDLSRSVFRRRRPGALAPASAAAAAWWAAATTPRTASTKTISTSPRSTARGLRRNQGGGCASRSTAAADGSAGYEVRTENSTALVCASIRAASPAAALSLPPPRWAAWICSFA